MMRNLARYEQFLRITTLLDILSNARSPLDDQALINAIRERLGLSRLSPRTLHRDCEFLVSCGYPIDHVPLAGQRRYGWQMTKAAAAGRQLPAEPITLSMPWQDIGVASSTHSSRQYPPCGAR